MKRFVSHMVLVLIPLLLPMAVVAQAQALPIQSPHTIIADSVGDARNGLCQVDSGSCQNGQSGIDKVASAVVNIISYVAGIIAVIMILVAGIRYTTSGGDSAKVSSAKTALIYALIGIAVAGLAQILIHLVLSTAASS